MHSFRHLLVWQEAVELAAEVFREVRRLPRDHAGVAHQMRGSARSVHANIAEGSAARSSRDFLRFLEYSQQSLRELESDAIALRRSQVLPKAAGDALASQIGRVDQLLTGFMKRIAEGD